MNEQNFDVVIIGAGINGAGLFRDLCEQGVNCLIFDKNDFGSGTSAAPSRLIHGGLKYLETGEFSLVAQSTLERNLLLKNAPHLVSPLETVIPIFSWWSGILPAIKTFFGSTTAPRSRGAVLVKLGLAIYDHYGSRHQTMPKHKMRRRRKALENMPHLTPKIVASGTYHDARIHHPERLVFELLSDGIAENSQSAAKNYTSLISSENGVLVLEGPSGKFTVQPTLVVNSAGPWIDEVNHKLGAPSKMIGGTKGSHILLRHNELVKSLNGQMIYFEANDGRVCLVFEYLGQALIGSTDIPANNPDTVSCENDEIDYMLLSLRELLPSLEFSRDQITYVYSGIRPLPASDASNPGLISRDHSSPFMEADATRPFPIISLVGGKWTTFRGFAEEVSDQVLANLGRDRKRSTKQLSIGGGHKFPQTKEDRQSWLNDMAQSYKISLQRAEQLLQRYGTKASQIAAHKVDGYDQKTLPDSKDYSYAEIDFVAQYEQVEHLQDIVMRRTGMAMSGQLTKADLTGITDIASKALNWSASRKKQEFQTTYDVLTGQHRMQL